MNTENEKHFKTPTYAHVLKFSSIKDFKGSKWLNHAQSFLLNLY